MKTFAIFGFILALGLLMVGIFFPVPTSELSYRNVEKYVGGDAYNYIIAAALEGGKISGAMTLKTVLIVGSVITFMLSGIILVLSKKQYEKSYTGIGYNSFIQSTGNSLENKQDTLNPQSPKGNDRSFYV